MSMKLTKRDYAVAAVVLVGLFFFLPLCLRSVSNYRKSNLERAIRSIVPAVLIEADQEIKFVQESLMKDILLIPTYDTYGTVQGVPTNQLVARACEKIQSSVIKQNPEYRMPDWNCYFYAEYQGYYYKADTSSIKRVFAPIDIDEMKELESAVVGWTLRDNRRSYWVIDKIQAEPLVALEFLIQPQDRDYNDYRL